MQATWYTSVVAMGMITASDFCTQSITKLSSSYAITHHSCDMHPTHKNQLTGLLEVISLNITSFKYVVTGYSLSLPHTLHPFNYFLFCTSSLSYIPTYKYSTHNV